MMLEDLRPDGMERGVLPDALVTVVNVAGCGPDGRVADEILYRQAGDAISRGGYAQDTIRETGMASGTKGVQHIRRSRNHYE